MIAFSYFLTELTCNAEYKGITLHSFIILLEKLVNLSSNSYFFYLMQMNAEGAGKPRNGIGIFYYSQ